MHARRIHEDDLTGGVPLHRGQVDHALNIAAGGLRLMSDDGDFFADQRIQQRGFARIGPSDDGNEAGAEGHPAHALIWRVSVGTRRALIRRRSTRRSVDSRTSKRKPSPSTTSPCLGMRPKISLTKPATVVASWPSGRTLKSSLR